MKRLLILSFILLTALVLICSCGEDEPAESSTSSINSSEATTDSSVATTESSESTTYSSNVAASGKDDLWTGNKQ